MDSRKVKKSVLNNLAYVIFGYVGNIICFAFRTAEGKNISEKILPAMTNLGTAFARILPSFNPIDLSWQEVSFLKYSYPLLYEKQSR